MCKDDQAAKGLALVGAIDKAKTEQEEKGGWSGTIKKRMIAGQQRPGEIITLNKTVLIEAVISAVELFEETNAVTVQSVHCYRTEPDPKLLNDQGKRKVDIILKL